MTGASSGGRKLLDGFCVLVTGASEGIGRGIALAAGAAGAAVVVTALDLKAAAGVADEIGGRGGKSVASVCDVRRATDIERAAATALRTFGRLDCFVHNANNSGAGGPPFEDVENKDWDAQIAVGLRPIFYCARTVLPALIQSRGSLIITTSPAGILGDPSMPTYSAVKGAQRALVKSLAREWGPLGVRVNAVSPSAVTPALKAYLEREPHMRSHLVARAALRRMGDPESDIGRVINFLIGADSGFISGQTLMVNGGALML